MKRFLLFSLFLAQASFAKGQQVYFVYLQTENRQPFYARLNEKLYSSSASGYLIIPKLQNGEYNFVLGFPKNEWPVQNITVMVNNRDLGFSFKNFAEKGWGLFNFQSMEILMATAGNQPAKPQTETSTDLFSNTLANVVNTPSIREKPKPEPEKPVEATKPEMERTEPVVEIKKAQELSSAEKITRINTYSDVDGNTFIYVIEVAGVKDTVRLFFSADKVLQKRAEELIDTVSVQKQPQEKTGVPQEKKTDDKFLSIELPNPNTSQAQQPEATSAGTGNGKLTFNSDCKTQASNTDFLKTRRKMAAVSGDAEMIAEARKSFRQKCFSADQVKNLSALFLTDEGKYQFFETAYPFVYDTQNFGSLISQLSGEPYTSRFKTLVHQ